MNCVFPSKLGKYYILITDVVVQIHTVSANSIFPHGRGKCQSFILNRGTPNNDLSNNKEFHVAVVILNQHDLLHQ